MVIIHLCCYYIIDSVVPINLIEKEPRIFFSLHCKYLHKDKLTPKQKNFFLHFFFRFFSFATNKVIDAKELSKKKHLFRTFEDEVF